MSAQASPVWCSCSPWRAVCLDMCACVSICDSGCVPTCVQGGVERGPHSQFPALSLKRAVKTLRQIPYIHLCQSTRHTLGVYTGGNTIYLMQHCPHVHSAPPHTGDSQCLTSISYSVQAGRQTGWSGEWTPSCCKSPFQYPTKCKLERVNTGALTFCFKIFVFVYSGMCNWFCILSVCKCQTDKSQSSFPLFNIRGVDENKWRLIWERVIASWLFVNVSRGMQAFIIATLNQQPGSKTNVWLGGIFPHFVPPSRTKPITGKSY